MRDLRERERETTISRVRRGCSWTEANPNGVRNGARACPARVPLKNQERIVWTAMRNVIRPSVLSYLSHSSLLMGSHPLTGTARSPFAVVSLTDLRFTSSRSVFLSFVRSFRSISQRSL